jgi:hypothetical protein
MPSRSSFEIASPHDDEDEHWEGDFHDEPDHSGGDDDDYDDAGGLANGHHGRVTVANGSNGGLSPAARGKRHKKMKKMKVATQRDYSSDDVIVFFQSARGTCVIAGVSCAFLLIVISFMIPMGSRQYATAGGQEPECEVHTTDEPFSEWMHNIKASNSSELCRPEVRDFSAET